MTRFGVLFCTSAAPRYAGGHSHFTPGVISMTSLELLRAMPGHGDACLWRELVGRMLEDLCWPVCFPARPGDSLGDRFVVLRHYEDENAGGAFRSLTGAFNEMYVPGAVRDDADGLIAPTHPWHSGAGKSPCRRRPGSNRHKACKAVIVHRGSSSRGARVVP